MSPTIIKIQKYRFMFFSREEERMHVHVMSPDGEAKFWIEPTVSLADFTGMKQRELLKIQKLVEENIDVIKRAWKKHFSS